MAFRRRPSTALASLVVAMTMVVARPIAAGAGPEEDLRAAQRRANQAAGELAEAEEARAHAEEAVAHAQSRVARLDARVARVRDDVRQLAVRLYVEGTAPISRLLRIADPGDVVRVQQYSRVIAGTSDDALRQYRADREELREETAVLETKQESQREAVETLRDRQNAIVAELDRLTRVVERERAARAEEARAQAAAAAAAAARTTPTATPGQAASPTAAAAQPAPVVEAPTSAPAPAPAPSAASGGWVCPVQGPHAFSNDYGAARWGGGSHMGNDILASRGTPVVAHVDGVVTHRSGSVSGLAYYLNGDDGNRYFGAHLDSFAASGWVSAGTVIGTVGNTGDASGGPPHLHFEMHPGGSGYTNPYPYLTQSC